MKVLTAGIMALLFSALAVNFGTVQSSTDVSEVPKPSNSRIYSKVNWQFVLCATDYDDRPIHRQTVTQGGYYVQGEPEIEITIKNQLFTRYVDTATNKGAGLFYQVRTKGHFSQNWSTVEYWTKEGFNPRNPYPEQDCASEYTVLKYGSLTNQNIQSEGQLDIQVQALI